MLELGVAVTSHSPVPKSEFDKKQVVLLKEELLSPDISKYAPGVVQWNGGKLEAFNHLKGVLVNVCVLTIPSQEDMFVLNTDASRLRIGATSNGLKEEAGPVAYSSGQEQGAQKHYSATESLAVLQVMENHKALMDLLKSRRQNQRLNGWAGVQKKVTLVKKRRERSSSRGRLKCQRE